MRYIFNLMHHHLDFYRFHFIADNYGRAWGKLPEGLRESFMEEPVAWCTETFGEPSPNKWDVKTWHVETYAYYGSVEFIFRGVERATAFKLRFV